MYFLCFDNSLFRQVKYYYTIYQIYIKLEEYPVYARKTSNVLGNTHCADHPGPIVMATLSLLCRLLPADTCSYTVMQFIPDRSCRLSWADRPGQIGQSVPSISGSESRADRADHHRQIVQICSPGSPNKFDNSFAPASAPLGLLEAHSLHLLVPRDPTE